MFHTLKERPKPGYQIMYCSVESFNSRDAAGLPVRWYAAEVIAIDEKEPVVKTMTGRYHRRPFDEYYFRPGSDQNVTQPNTVKVESIK